MAEKKPTRRQPASNRRSSVRAKRSAPKGTARSVGAAGPQVVRVDPFTLRSGPPPCNPPLLARGGQLLAELAAEQKIRETPTSRDLPWLLEARELYRELGFLLSLVAHRMESVPGTFSGVASARAKPELVEYAERELRKITASVTSARTKRKREENEMLTLLLSIDGAVRRTEPFAEATGATDELVLLAIGLFFGVPAAAKLDDESGRALLRTLTTSWLNETRHSTKWKDVLDVWRRIGGGPSARGRVWTIGNVKRLWQPYRRA